MSILAPTFPRVFSKERYAFKKRRKIYRLKQVNTQSVSQSVTVAQVIAKSCVFTKSLSNSIAVSQTVVFIGKTFTRDVVQDIVVTQTLKPNLARLLSVVQSVTVTQLPANDQAHVSHNITVSQVVVFHKTITRQVNHSIAVADFPFVSSPRLMIVSHNLAVFIGLSAKNATNRQSLTQTVTVGQALVRKDAIIRQSLTHSIVVTQKVNSEWLKSIVHDITVQHHISGTRHIVRNFADVLTTNDALTYNRNITRTIVDQASFHEVLTRQVHYNRTLTDVSTLVEQFKIVVLQGPPVFTPPALGQPITIPHRPPPIPGIITAQIDRFYVDGENSSIVLPSPDLGDSIKNLASVEIKRSEVGDFYTYVQSSDIHLLAFSWRLGMAKAYEIQQFLIDNLAKQFKITTHKGEVWVVNIVGNPVILESTQRAAGERELYSLNVEFQGVKIDG